MLIKFGTSDGKANMGKKTRKRNEVGHQKMVSSTQSKSELILAIHNKASKKSLVHTRAECCAKFLLLKEDNIRFILLAILIIIYMLVGAVIFQALEEGFEKSQFREFRSSFTAQVRDLKKSLKSKNATIEQVETLMYIWGNATAEGIVSFNPRWDYAGSFHFVYTVVSTIGYGAATPKTIGGKIFLIIYGFLACSSGILFFNLFLERIITFIAYIMKANYQRQLRHQVQEVADSTSAASSEELDSWRPSVYWVMVYLCVASVFIGLLASLLFMQIEDWSYVNSVYFCFVAFSTIGFGDFVSAQREYSFYGPSVYAYQFGNFLVMVLGCSCIYSLFNVISILIKQFLNWIIKWMALCADPEEFQLSGMNFSPMEKSSKRDLSNFDQSEAERKLSGQIFTLQDYIASKQSLQSNVTESSNDLRDRDTPSPCSRKVSATSRMLSASSRKLSKENFIPGQVGSLAIASSKVSED